MNKFKYLLHLSKISFILVTICGNILFDKYKSKYQTKVGLGQ